MWSMFRLWLTAWLTRRRIPWCATSVPRLSVSKGSISSEFSWQNKKLSFRFFEFSSFLLNRCRGPRLVKGASHESSHGKIKLCHWDYFSFIIFSSLDISVLVWIRIRWIRIRWIRNWRASRIQIHYEVIKDPDPYFLSKLQRNVRKKSSILKFFMGNTYLTTYFQEVLELREWKRSWPSIWVRKCRISWG